MKIQSYAETNNANALSAKQKLGSQGTLRLDWIPNFSFTNPDDWGLALPTNIDQKNIPCELLEVYKRFFDIGFIDRYGAECIMMSKILRRVLRLHGIEAYTRQVVFQLENETKGWRYTMGGENQLLENNRIDVHMIVAARGYILDFSQRRLHSYFGFTAPIAFIGPDDPSTYFGNMIDFGSFGNATWIPRRPLNDHVRHSVYMNKAEEIRASREYFDYYNMRPYISKDPNV